MQLIGRKKVERRRWKRHSFVAPVRVVTDSAIVDARCIRMSEGGIYLFAAADLPTGAEIKVELMTDASEKMFSRSGIVRHRALYLYGVEFIAGDRHKPDLALQAPEIPHALASIRPN